MVDAMAGLCRGGIWSWPWSDPSLAGSRDEQPVFERADAAEGAHELREKGLNIANIHFLTFGTVLRKTVIP